MGTGTGDMIARCKEAGLAEPEFQQTDGFVITLRRKPERAFEAVGGTVTGEVTGVVTGEVTGEVARLILVMNGEMGRREIQAVLGLKHEDYFREAYLTPALQAGLIEMTVPDKPTSRLQKYRLTARGREWLASKK
jgi:predicted HTH transcriptional regulator